MMHAQYTPTRSRRRLFERTESSSSFSSTTTTSNSNSNNAESSSLPDGAAGRWKYSKPRQLAFWVKKSVRDVIAQDLNSVYETEINNSNLNKSAGARNTLTADGTEGGGVMFREEELGGGWNMEDYSNNNHHHDNDGNDDIGSPLHLHPPCESIDEAMSALHSLTGPIASTYPAHYQCEAEQEGEHDKTTVHHPYDWMLDGDPDDGDSDGNCDGNGFGQNYEYEYNHNENTMQHNPPPQSCFNLPSSPHPQERRRRKKLHSVGDEDLDCALAALELESSASMSVRSESTSTVTTTMDNALPSTPITGQLKSNDGSCSCNGIDKSPVDHVVLPLGQGDDNDNCNDKGNAPYSSVQKGSEILLNYIPPFLPFEDPSTPEGNFIRRIQVEFDKDDASSAASDNDSSIASEMADFFPNDDNENDPVLQILQTIPWDIDAGDEMNMDTDNDEEMHRLTHMHMTAVNDVHLVEKLSSLDEMAKNVTDELLTLVSRQDADIALEMKRAQDVDDDITSALSFANQAVLYLCRARGGGNGTEKRLDLGHGGGVLGGMHIMNEASERERLKKVDELLRCIEEVVMMEASVFDFCDDLTANIMCKSDGDGGGGIGSLLETCNTLKSRLLQDERLLRLSCLNESRARVSRIMEYSCSRIEEELRLFLYRQCNFGTMVPKADVWSTGSWNEYSTLLDARLVFDDYQMQESKENINDMDIENDSCRVQIESAWAKGVLGGLCFEADRCLAKALLHPTNIEDDHDEDPSEFDRNLLEIESKLSEIQEFDENAASLRSMIKNLASIRFEFDPKDHHIIGVFHSLCLNLADVLHTHHMLCEWHRKRVNGSESRCESPLQDEEECSNAGAERIDVTTKDDQTKSTYSYSSHTSSSQSSCHLPVKSSDIGIPRCISGPQTFEEEASVLFSRRKMTQICENIANTKVDLWFHCRGRIIAFLKIIIEMEEDKAESSWSSTWVQDLDTFRGIYELCHQMNLFGLDFLGTENKGNILSLEGGSSVECELRETLSKIFRTFVHGAHCEAMTEMGNLMATETWDLLPVPLKGNKQSDRKIALQCGICTYLRDLMGVGSSRLAAQKVWENRFMSCNNQQYLLSYCIDGNPFVPLDAEIKNEDDSTYPTLSDSMGERDNNCADELYEKVASYFSSETGDLVLGTKSSLNGLARWTARLLKIELNLPIVSDYIATIVSNLYDLYFVTVFRLCCSNSTTESIMFGNQKRSDHAFHEQFPQDLSPSQAQLKKMKSRPLGSHRSNSYSRRRNNASVEAQLISNTKLVNTMASRFCEADMIAPLLDSEEPAAMAREFICRGQATLSSMVKLDQIERWSLFRNTNSDSDERVFAAKCLEKRIAAASSILFVGCMLDTSFHTITETQADDNSEGKRNSILAKYLKEMTQALNHVNTMCLRISSMRSINGRNVVLNIISIGTGWSDSNLHEHCNTYVDNLSDRYVALWTHLCTSSLKSLKEMLFDAWRYVVESGYLALLEGFSKIHDCSTEGRALMSIDLATFSSNMNKHTMVPVESVNSPFLVPPSVDPKHGMEYVDMYIKVYYFPDEDVMNWIAQNRKKYHLSHLLTLVSLGAHNQLHGKHIHHLMKRRGEVKRILPR